jgi:hypothetical protein
MGDGCRCAAGASRRYAHTDKGSGWSSPRLSETLGGAGAWRDPRDCKGARRQGGDTGQGIQGYLVQLIRSVGLMDGRKD